MYKRQVLAAASALSSAKETINIPAADARTWTYMRVTLTNPEELSAITSVGVKYVSGDNSRYIWINDIKAVRSESAVFRRLWPGSYRIEREARKVFLKEDSRAEVGYSLIRLIGYKLPSLLTADSDTATIAPDLIAARDTRTVSYTHLPLPPNYSE